MAGKLTPSSYEPPHQWNLYQWFTCSREKLKGGKGWGKAQSKGWTKRVITLKALYLACKWQMFLLPHRRWGTFREEEHLRLSDRNSILMTQNLSEIRSEELIGRRSSFIVLAIVYEWQTKDKRRAAKVKCKHDESLIKLIANWWAWELKTNVNIDLRHQYGISVTESQMFLLAKRPSAAMSEEKHLPFAGYIVLSS